MSFDVGVDDRAKLWQDLTTGIDAYLDEVAELDVARPTTEKEVEELLAAFDFDHPIAAADAVELAFRGLRELQQHGRHPRSFGLFDAAPTALAIVGDTLAATFNGCLATRGGSPFGVAAEDKLVAAFGARFGYPAGAVDGIVTSGGSESNLSAILLALAHLLPGYATRGLVGTARRPVVYVSPEAHPSVPRAVRLAGLGADSVRVVPTDPALRMDLAALDRLIRADRQAGLLPLAVVVTAGTTGAGVIDPLDGAADVAARHGVWLHVDAAWGGAAALLAEPDPAFRGLARADSLTFDPHKWLSVPLGMGLFLTPHRGLLERTFAVGPTFLDPAEGSAGEPFGRSLRWSRGFAALKVLLPLAVAGWRGLEGMLRRQIDLGDDLRRRLAGSGWRIVNDTPLPVVCFMPDDPATAEPDRLRLLAKMANATGQVRVFVVRIGARYALRACVTNPATTGADIDVLVEVLTAALRRLAGGGELADLGGIAVDVGTCQGLTA